MARLQDFNSVTPTGSDNLLIVQSQGQGLSTLNAVGQKVANDTTISSLATTAKTIVGAINENKSDIDSKTASDIEYSSGVTVKAAIDDLNTYKPISYTPTTNTVTISTSFFSGACKVIVARAYDTYDANIEFIAGANASNSVISEVFKGSAVTIAKVDGKTITISENGLANATIILIPYRGDWNISG